MDKFYNKSLIGLKWVLLYSLYSMIVSIVLLITDAILKNNYEYNPYVSGIALVRFFVISILIILCNFYSSQKIKIHYSKLFLIAIIFDSLFFLIFHPFNNVLVYGKISCLSTLVPLYLVHKSESYLPNVIDNINLKIGCTNRKYAEYSCGFLIYATNPLLIFSLILMFISYDFLVEDVAFVFAIAIVLYAFCKFFVGLLLAFWLKNQDFYINFISEKLKWLILSALVIDIICISICYVYNGGFYLNDFFSAILCYSITFAFLPFYLVYVFANHRQKF